MNALTQFVNTNKVPILTVSGVCLGAVGVGFTVYNSIKYGDEMKEHFEDLKFYKESYEKQSISVEKDVSEYEVLPYTKVMYENDRKNKIKDILKLSVKMFSVPAAFLLGSTSCFIGAIGIQAHNIAIIGASFNALTSAYENYRNKVIDTIGEDEEKKLRLGLREVTETVKVVDVNGKTKEIKKKSYVKENDEYGDDMYVFDFSESSNYYAESPELNSYFIRAQEATANSLLAARGWIFLNEVLINLGFKPTKFGQFVGWVIDGQKNGGDGNVDFRMVPIKRMKDGKEIYTYMLDFNVDGVIVDTKWFDYKKLK